MIVAAARSPVGRAITGSMTGMRGDDLTVQIVQAVFAQIPEFLPHTLEEFIVGCGPRR